jgi:hypothetical protein
MWALEGRRLMTVKASRTTFREGCTNSSTTQNSAQVRELMETSGLVNGEPANHPVKKKEPCRKDFRLLFLSQETADYWWRRIGRKHCVT